MLIPYHSNRLLPLVVADSASSFYDTKINKKITRIYIVIRLYHIQRRLKDGRKIWLCLGLFSKRRSSSLPIRLSSDTSVFRSESIALLEASSFAAKLLGSTIMFTDSKSNLETLKDQTRNSTAFHYLTGKSNHDYSMDTRSLRNPRQRYCRYGCKVERG